MSMATPDQLTAQLSQLAKRVAEMEDLLNDPDAGLVRVNERLDDPDAGIDKINQRLDHPTGGLSAIKDRIDANDATLADHASTLSTHSDRLSNQLSRIQALESDSHTHGS